MTVTENTPERGGLPAARLKKQLQLSSNFDKSNKFRMSQTTLFDTQAAMTARGFN